jgi:DNA repair protein RadC
MSTKFIVYSASAVSAVALLAALFTTVAIFNDVNSLYNEIMAEMQEFKDLSNAAWTKVMNAHAELGPMTPAENFRLLVKSDPNVEINFVKDSEGWARVWRVQL